MTANASALVGPELAEASAAGAAGAPPAPRSFATTSLAAFGSIFFRNVSYCEAITLPEILSFPPK